MKLYYAPGTCAVAVWIALEWMGADYEVEKVVLGSDEYKKINPSGEVPALDTGDGKIKTQAGAILSYLAEKYEESDLGPDQGLEDRFLFNELTALITGDFHPAFWPLFGPTDYTTSRDEKDLENVKQAAYKNVDTVASLIDQRLEDRDHIYKNKRTVLDPYAFVMMRWMANTPKSWKEYPNIKRFMEKMYEDPVVNKVLEESVK